MYVNGVSTRKVKDALRAVSGEKIRLSRSTVSRITKKLREDFRAWQRRSLKELDVACLFPAHHWKRMRTSNKLERLNREIRRRLNVIGRHPDENGCLWLIYAVTKKYASSQRKFRVGDLERQLWKKLRERKIEMIEQLTLDLYAA